MVASPYEAFAKRLKEVLRDRGREERGSGRYLADICGLSKESGRKWLEGTSLPTMEHVIQIAEELEVCVEWLLTGRGPKKPPSPRTVAHMDTFDTLAPDDQVTIQEVTDAFAQSAQLSPWKEVTERRGGGKAGAGSGTKNP